MEIDLRDTDGHELSDPLGDRDGALDDLLRSLDDDELVQFLRYWVHRRARNAEAAEGRGVWWADKHLEAGRHEAFWRGFSVDLTTAELATR